VHAAEASRGRPACPPPWRAGPARGPPSPPRRVAVETDASLSAAAATPPAGPRGRAARPGCAGSAGPPRAPTPPVPADCTPPRSSAGPGHTPSKGRRLAGTQAGRTPRSAAPPRDSCARRLLAPRPGVRYLLLTGLPHSHTWARRLRKAFQPLLEGLSSSGGARLPTPPVGRPTLNFSATGPGGGAPRNQANPGDRSKNTRFEETINRR
jgi:hypothetical protein